MSWRSASRRIGVPRFLPVPVGGRELSGHDKLSKRYQVPIDGRKLSCHDEIVQMASKKQDTIRQLAESADRPTDFVSAAGTVRVAQDFIGGLNFSLIDFWDRLGSCPGCRPCPAKPVSCYNEFVSINKRSGKPIN
jgi:hypothetical protein